MSTFQVEEEADLGAASAGGGTHGGEAGDGVDSVLDGLGDEDLHLFDGHDAVVDADDDAGKIRFGEDGDGHAQSEIDAAQSEDDGEEEDGFDMAREPERGAFHTMLRCIGRTGMDGVRRHQSFSSIFARGGFGFVRVFIASRSDLYLGAVIHRVRAGGDHLLASLQAFDDLGLVVLRDARVRRSDGGRCCRGR